MNNLEKNKDKYYIICSDSKKEYRADGSYFGMSGMRALYYSTEIGRRRVYRSSYPSPDCKFKLFKYKRKSNAEKLCNEINKSYGDTFYVKEVFC